MSKVYTINLGMVNVYLIQENENNVLVDTGDMGSHKKIVKELNNLNVDPKSIKLIILTHGHNDHYGSVKELADATGAKVLIHKSEHEQLQNWQNGELVPTNFLGKILSNSISKKDQNSKKELGFTADILIDETFNLMEYGIPAKVVLTPGHTIGSISILTEGGEALIGDSLMSFISKKTPKKPMFAYDLEEVKKSIKMLINIGAKRFYLSHGRDYSVDVIEKAISKF